MSEMKDRIKRVINLWALSGSKWSDDLARDILEAMRDPTEAMKEAWDGHGPAPWDDDALELWQILIDAALADAPNH